MPPASMGKSQFVVQIAPAIRNTNGLLGRAPFGQCPISIQPLKEYTPGMGIG